MNNEIASDPLADALHDAGGPAASEKYFEDWLILSTTYAAWCGWSRGLQVMANMTDEWPK